MKIRFICFLKIMSVGHVLDQVLDHLILGLVSTALPLANEEDRETATSFDSKRQKSRKQR